MKINRFSILIILVLFLSCGTEPVKVEVKKVEEVKPEVVKIGDLEILETFFKRSELDSNRAGKVLEKEKVIQHLTHLWKMDRGGKKYYLLEKDDITEMIKSVTEGIYLDYIMINKYGDIIYTRSNNELFGTNVNSGYEGTPLQKCFLNRTGVFFEDVSYIAPSSKIYSLYISSPVYVEGSFHGILILQVDIKKISEILEKETEIFSRDGIIRVTPVEKKIFTKYSGYDKIDMINLDANKVEVINQADGKLKFKKFNFREIDWILMNKEP